MSEQATETTARTPISPQALALAKQLGETKFAVLKQLDRCVRVLGEPAIDELLQETEQLEQGDGLLTNDGQRRRTKGGVFLHLARERCTPEQRAIVFPQTDWHARKAARKANAQRAQPSAAAAPVVGAPGAAVPLPADLGDGPGTAATPASAKLTYFFPGVSTLKTTLKGRPLQATVADGYTRLLFERTEAKDSFPAGIPAAPSEPQRVTVYVGAKQWAKVASELQKPTINLTIDGVMILENGKLVLRAQSVSAYEKPAKT